MQHKKTILVFAFLIWLICGFAQPALVFNNPYAPVNGVTYDSAHKRIYISFLSGCPTWNVPCAIVNLSTMHNLVNKHRLSDNNVSQVLESRWEISCPSYSVNNYNSEVIKQARIENNYLYSNFGFFFHKVDTNFSNLPVVWSYSPSFNASYKEISTFEMRSDSVFLFQKDSTSGFNLYSLLVKNKYTGNDIPYNSLVAGDIGNTMGAIQGYIHSSLIVGNKIVLAGNFLAYISGIPYSRNLAYIDIATGQLTAPPFGMDPGTIIYDMKLRDGKIYIAGLFNTVNGSPRNNYVVLDQNLNLLPETVQFYGTGIFSPAYVNKIVFYDKYLIASGNYNNVNGNVFAPFENYVAKVIDLSTGSLMPWAINLPGPPVSSNNVFEMHRNKLYIQNKAVWGSPLYIYCFQPIQLTSNVLYNGSTLPTPNSSISVCAPDDGSANTFVAPIRYADTYTWTYSGTNATVVPLGNGSTAKIILGSSSTSGVLSVTAYNDCSLSSGTSTLSVIVKQKPVFVLPSSPQTIFCNPDSILLQTNTTNTAATIQWRKSNATTYNSQPYFVKSGGAYFSVVNDNSNGCKDSGMVNVKMNKIMPNSKITSHTYPGVLVPIDTITCIKPNVNITGASDTSGVIVNWKSVSNNSSYINPLNASNQGNFKLIVTRTSNNCVDSSLIVLVGKNNDKPQINILNKQPELNCSVYNVTLHAITHPSNCITTWENWNGAIGQTPINVTAGGKHYITAVNPNNGCSFKDSVNVTTTNKLIILSSSDTTVCRQSQLNLNAIAQGTVTGITYSWNIGSVSQAINVTANASYTYIVNASEPGGCSGTDSIFVKVPSDISDSVIVYRDCNGENKGAILVYAKGGIPPYKYSINNGFNFSSQSFFNDLPFGTYSVLIKDSIGCIRSMQAILNAESNLPQPKFLASTHNQLLDTIVLVDISIPQPDSIHWILPNGIKSAGGNMFSKVILADDTGNFTITMKGYFGHCEITSTKLIRFGAMDPLKATDKNNNGIKSFSVFPNPNSGEFTVQLNFFKKQNASIQIWDNAGQFIYGKNFYDESEISLPFHLTQLLNGHYMIRAIGEYDSRNLHFIISK